MSDQVHGRQLADPQAHRQVLVHRRVNLEKHLWRVAARQQVQDRRRL